MAAIRFTLNGSLRAVEAASDTPLLWVLRDTMRLTGTKFGCGEGICGACTVLQDGRAVRSCRLQLSAAAGSRITTIEGLAAEYAFLQLAWLREAAAQCGYCQPAMLLAAAALLRAKPHPTDAEIDAAIGGIDCRCGSYPRIRHAVLAAAGR